MPLGTSPPPKPALFLTLVMRRIALLLLALFAFQSWGQSPPSQTQQIALNYGWNLISLQVGTPSGFPIAQVLASLDRTNALASIWAYDPVTRAYTSFQTSPANFPSDLTSLRPGLGYWVQVNTGTVLTLSGPEWNGSLSLVPGWNLVGFAGLNHPATKSPPLPAKRLRRGRQR